MSDLHLDHDYWNFSPANDVFYIIAGDIYENDLHRRRWLERFNQDNLFWIKGNHDFYNDTFDKAMEEMKTGKAGNLTIAGATLWTALRPHEWMNFVYTMADGTKIQDLAYDKYVAVHNAHKQFLFKSNADIWVIHHCPSFLSVHPKYKGDPANIFFASELYEEIASLPQPPKLIVHGHTHEVFDYMIGENTRVICHPRGYPYENRINRNYSPLILGIE